MKDATGCPHRHFSGVHCTGRILPTGYCDECGRSRTARRIPRDARRGTDGGPAHAAPFTLPSVPPPSDPTRQVEPEGRVPLNTRICGNFACGALIAPPLVPEPVPDEGWCPECGVPFSFVSPLEKGELLHDQYEVLGFIAHGGQGRVHLAADTHLRPKHVAVKGLLNRHDEHLARLAEMERRYLIALNHPGIVRILDYVRHQPARATSSPRGEPPTHYIVMEYAGSSTLHDIVSRTRQGELPLGTPLDIEHVITYGCLILDALAHLHDNGLVYVDMKPSNVMHVDDGIKVIDLGAVRPAGDREAELVVTEHYAAPEVRETGPTVAHDLHTVGRTLEELARYAERNVPGLGVASFRQVLKRATHPEAALRFSSAREMAGQLRGALREIRALRGGRDRPEPSRYFSPSPALLGHELGGIPPAERWSRHAPPSRRQRSVSPPLNPALPTAATVAVGLPVPRPHRSDPRSEAFGLASYGPDQVMKHLPEQPSAEVCFHNVRRLLGLENREALKAAEGELDRAVTLLGAGASERCWRVAWHRGLLALARSDKARAAGSGTRELDQLDEARCQFGTVMTAMPGEYAPKLAVAYCIERLPSDAAARHPKAKELYEVVWLRNRAHGSAAFGLARLALAHGARAEVTDILDQVPEEARDHPAARIAALRVQGARLECAERPLPTLEDLRAVQERLAEAFQDRSPLPDLVPAGEARLRLRTELMEWALDTLYEAETVGLPDGPSDEDPHYTDLLGPPPAWSLRERPGRAVAEGSPYSAAPPSVRPRRTGPPVRAALGGALRDRLLPGSRHTPVRAARFRLAECYRELAWRSPRRADHARLADWANAVRPPTFI